MELRERASAVADALADDINDRSGMGIDSFDDEVQTEILTAWTDIVEEHLAAAHARGRREGIEEVLGLIDALEQDHAEFGCPDRDFDCLKHNLAALLTRAAEGAR